MVDVRFGLYGQLLQTLLSEDMDILHSLMFSGDMELSPRWTFGFSSGYDFVNRGFTYTQFQIWKRPLSWRMDFTWIPFGHNSSWNFFIGIKSNVLQDLKYEQRRQPDRQVGS